MLDRNKEYLQEQAGVDAHSDGQKPTRSEEFYITDYSKLSVYPKNHSQ